MAKSKFVYSIYIAASPERVWKALLDGEFTRQYWGHENVSDWKPGSSWEHRRDDANGAVVMVGEVIEADAPRRLVITWAEPRNRSQRDLHSRVTFELERVGEMVRLTIEHEDLDPEMERKISQGWPRVLSSLKSLLETGRPLPTWEKG
jgi:uncharacterized protein YndB with AHSA1/START domain